jgi:hypothetical protein
MFRKTLFIAVACPMSFGSTLRMSRLMI